MLYSELYGKQIIDIDSMTNLGEIDGMYLTAIKAISHFASSLGYYVSVDSLSAMGDVAEVKFTAAEREDGEPQNDRLPHIGASAIDTDGKLIGKVTDYAFTKNFRLKSLILGDITINTSRILRFGANNILLKGRNRTKIVTKSVNEDSPRNIAPSSATNTAENPMDTYSIDSNGFIATKIVGNYDFLIGRRLTKDIVKNGEIIAARGRVIDGECVRRSSDLGKLVELAIYSEI